MDEYTNISEVSAKYKTTLLSTVEITVEKYMARPLA